MLNPGAFFFVFTFCLARDARANDSGERTFFKNLKESRTEISKEFSRVSLAGRAENEGSDLFYRLTEDDNGVSCRNSKGELGLNKIDFDRFKADKQGECGEFSGIDLSRADLRGAHLAGALFINCDLHGADFSEADFKGARIIDSNLNGAFLAKASMRFVSLNGVDLSGARLTWARLTVIADNVRFSRANLRGADLHASIFRRARFQGANLRGANLARTVLEGADLTEADFSGANLLEAKFGGSQITAADFKGAWYDDSTTLPFDESEAPKRGLLKKGGDKNLCQREDGRSYTRRATQEEVLKEKNGECVWFWSNAPQWAWADLSGANLIKTNLERGDLTSADLSKADMRGAILRSAKLNSASMANSRLVWADLRDASLTDADLRGAALGTADLTGADLRGARLQGTDLSWADLSQARLDQAEYNDATILPFDDQAAAERGLLKQ